MLERIFNQTELDFTSAQYIERLPSQVIHVIVTYKRIEWILVAHVATMVTVYISTEQSLQHMLEEI